MGGGTIITLSLKTKGNKKNFFKLGQFFYKLSYMTPLYLLIIVFLKFSPLKLLSSMDPAGLGLH
jgi:hypothetical protein